MSRSVDEITALVIDAMSGNEAAFGVLVQQHAGLVTGVAYSILGDFPKSEDIGQEAFLTGWKKLHSLADPAKFPAWICGIARNKAMTLRRQAIRATEASLEAAVVEPESAGPSAEEVAIGREERSLVWESLEALPDIYRESIVLYYRGEQSVGRVAETLGESKATIRQRLVRGRKLLTAEVESIVNRTLRGTTPKAAFAAAVLASVPGNASAAVAGASTVGVTGHSGSAAATGWLGAAGGAAFGTFAGFLGGAIGTYFSYRNAPYASQRRLIARFSVLMFAWIAFFTIIVSWLVAVQTSATPMKGTEYAITLLFVIFGFQLTLCGLIAWMSWQYKRLGKTAEQTGEPLNRDVAERSARVVRPARWYTGSRQLFGRPLIDVQFGSISADGKVDQPRTARGWIAMGDRAHGYLLAVGSFACGFVAVGGRSVGGLAIGGVACGIVSVGGLTAGLMSVGGLACGIVTCGGLAIGVYSLAGIAVGVYSVGGVAFGWQMASGAVAWSQHACEGQIIFGCQSEEATRNEISAHWFMSLFRYEVANPEKTVLSASQRNAVVVVATACIALATIIYRKMIVPRLQTDVKGSRRRHQSPPR
ncbi:sigma-70 family RNA polymerase sigma factor [Roseiconus lacunae]|uniref:RNA polymerase sigma factor n=1 Tax=Roseiconus lacunae TaxID=2605694 RepID=UPI00309348CD|nr:sigma-70 family RNA polymerase sigma factor [Stieleria sp. HD01]